MTIRGKMTIRMSIVVACMVVQANANDIGKGQSNDKNDMISEAWLSQDSFEPNHALQRQTHLQVSLIRT